jgi:hypothetical protein
VTPSRDGNRWVLVDLLGRSMGCIARTRGTYFTIHPEGHAAETMADMKLGPFNSLDAALAEIERHTRGICRMAPGLGDEEAAP